MFSQIASICLAGGGGLVASVILGPILIPLLTRLKVGQTIREDGPARHLAKAGTPTMGGIIIVAAVTLSSLLGAGRSREVWAALLVMLAFAGIGFWDDYIKVVLKRSLGLRAREKLVLQLVFGLIFGFSLVYYLGRGTEVFIPYSNIVIDFGYFYLPFVVVVLMSSANGANLTDGLDGLAAGVTFFISMACGLVAVIMSHPEISIFSAALCGACLGFLVFNHYPAQVFMGDTGSMALGAAVAAMACICRAEIALILIAGVYVIETLSVIIQVVSFQAFRRRVFLMAPLHHHFELKGWTETRVVIGFWLASLGFGVLGLLGLITYG